MAELLSISKVKELVRKAEEAFRHEDCESCECYLGYIIQLKIDSNQEARRFLDEYLSDRDQVHSCLGCDPCPPGMLYANYLRNKSSKSE